MIGERDRGRHGQLDRRAGRHHPARLAGAATGT